MSGHDHGIARARCLAATMAAIIWLLLLAPLIPGWGTQRLVTREFAVRRTCRRSLPELGDNGRVY